MEENKKSVFEVLNAINCNEHTEKKNNLTYLSWAWAWQIVKQNYPDAQYTIYESPQGWNYFTDGRTCWVKTGVTINGLEHIEYLPVMDYKNASIAADKVTSFDVNKAIQRSLTKAVARHGLGLYIYAGEDLPDSEDDAKRESVKTKPKKVAEPEDLDLDLALDEVKKAKTKEELTSVWENWKGYQNNLTFWNAVKSKNNELQK